MILPYHFKSYPFRLMAAVAVLNAVGILVIHSATNSDMAVVGRQLTGAAIGAAAMLILSLIPYQIILRHAVPVFGALGAVVTEGCIDLSDAAEVFATITDNAIRHILDNRHPLARSSFGQLPVFTGTPGIVRSSVSECLGRLAVNRDTESSHIPLAIRSQFSGV